MYRVNRIVISAITACVISSIIFILAGCLKAPGIYTDPSSVFMLQLTNLVIFVPIYIFVPIIFLSIYGWKKELNSKLWIAIIVPILWLLVLYFLWRHRAIYVHGFQWWDFSRQYIQNLPPMLALGWTFWKVLHSLSFNKQPQSAGYVGD